MAFVGNTRRSVAYMLKHTDLFEELPKAYYDTAFLDRLHFYLPGWEVDIIRGEMFSGGYGFIVDYYAEILRKLRGEDYSQVYRKYFELDSDISTRDRDSIHKTFSGLIKILFPNQDATKEEVRELLVFAIEGRKRVKSQLLKIDETYSAVNFAYTEVGRDESIPVLMLEERNYPHLFGDVATTSLETAPEASSDANESSEHTDAAAAPAEPALVSGEHRTVVENQKGISYQKLFGDHLKGASSITIQDPYIRQFHQVRNVMELMEVVIAMVPEGEEIAVELVTKSDQERPEAQDDLLQQLQVNLAGTGVDFTYRYDSTPSFHARSISTDTGWKITLDRGLDVFQHFDTRDRLNPQSNIQALRSCKAFEVTYLKI